MQLRLDGKVALVTGGSRGIGRGCALALAGAGAKVVVNYHSNHEAAREVVAQIRDMGGEAFVWQADVADRKAVEAMIDAAWKRFGPVDTLVANAVTSTRKSFLETDLELLRRTLDVALFGYFHVCQEVARRLISARLPGSIAVIGSLHAVYPLPLAFDYNVAKAATHHMAMTMANELAPHRIRVNLVIPGWIDTPGERKWVSEEELYRQGAQLPWGRLGTPVDVGNVVLFLASDAAEYVSGAVYSVDGALGVSMASGGSSEVRND